MQSAPPEHPDTSPTAPNTQRDRDEAKYTKRDHDNMKPQDRFSYIDAEGRGHIMAGSISAGWVSQSASSATSGGVPACKTTVDRAARSRSGHITIEIDGSKTARAGKSARSFALHPIDRANRVSCRPRPRGHRNRYADFLNCSNRSASRSRSGRSSLRLGNWITCPTIPFSPSSRKGPSWISSSRSETWMWKSGSIPIRCTSKAAWWNFVSRAQATSPRRLDRQDSRTPGIYNRNLNRESMAGCFGIQVPNSPGFPASPGYP